MLLMPTPKGLVFTVDLSKLEGRENPRTVEAPIVTSGSYPEPIFVDWGDGSAPEQISSGAWPSHEYAAEGVYTITIRTVTGHLPDIMFTSNTSVDEEAEKGVTDAIVSVDHFSGWIGNQTSRIYRYVMMNTVNLKYFDARIFGQCTWTNLQRALDNCGSVQPFRSMCFDFCDSLSTLYVAFRNSKMTGPLPNRMFANCPVGSFSECFRGCLNLTYIPNDLLGDTSTVTSMSGTFRGCSNPDLTDPFVFWKDDGTVDANRFPSLNVTSYCYTACNESLRAKVPEAYGGTAS